MPQQNPQPKQGDCVFCRVQSPELGGYSVILTPSGIEGFLPSQDPIEIGRIVPATFVCMNDSRALLTYAFIMGTSSRIQHSTASDQENAFAIWAEAYPVANRPGRAIDLIMPSIDSSPILLKLDENSAKELFPSLESSGFTGCIKVISQKKLSRAAVIFLNGRAVGSVYTTKLIPEPYRFEAGLKKLIEDVSAADTDAEMEMYELRAELILAMSSMFLGFVDRREDKLDNVSYAENMLSHFKANRGTACLSLMLESQTPCALGFICKGEFQGSYFINDRTFSADREFFFRSLNTVPDSKLKTYVLPPAMTTESVLFGYSLSSDQFTRPQG